MEEPDVRVEGLSHAQIVAWVRQGKAGGSTTWFEQQMQRIIKALHYASDEVNRAVQQTKAGTWEGSAAQNASATMAILRDFDDEFHTHGNADVYSVMGQSGESAATRDRVPPIPLHLDAQPTILGSTVDPKFRIDARRAAEEQARLVLAEYQEATRHRLAQLPRIPPVPKVVLDTASHDPESPGTPGRSSPRLRPPAGTGGGQATPARRTPVEPTRPIESPGQGAETADAGATAPRTTGQGQVVASVAARGDPAAARSPVPTAFADGIAAPPIGGGSAVIGAAPVGGGDGARPGEGPKSGVERVVERQRYRQRETPAQRTSGSGGLVGGAAGAPHKEEEEHQNRYQVPSGEPFDADDEYLRDGEFYVAPDVIGGPE